MNYNIQNLLILYILNLFCLIQWGKWLFKKFLELTYYWFHIQYDEKFFVLITNEIIQIFFSIFSFNFKETWVLNLQNLSDCLYFSNELNLWKYINWILLKSYLNCFKIVHEFFLPPWKFAILVLLMF